MRRNVQPYNIIKKLIARIALNPKACPVSEII